jgi:aromatic-L-amino-acid/L-tryptophan decarboxylase
VRDPEHLVRVMSTNPSFLQTDADGRVKNYRDWGIPLGRRFRALKLWTLILAQGVEGLQTRLRRDLENARWLEAQVRAAPDWKVLAPVALQTVCVRHEPPGLEGESLDSYTQGWAARVNRSGDAYLTPATLEGRWMVRVSVGAVDTEHRHVEALWRVMQREAASALKRHLSRARNPPGSCLATPLVQGGNVKGQGQDRCGPDPLNKGVAAFIPASQKK